MDNTGSFASATGGMSPELQAAVQRRQGGNPSGPMAQVTPTAPTFNPSTQVPNPTPSPSAGSPGLTSSNPAMGTGVGLPMNTPESELIIKALDSRLKALSKIQGA